MPRIGDKSFAVEWTTEVPVIDGEAFFEHAQENVRRFSTLAEAKRFAETIFNRDFFGEVRIDEDTFEPFDEEDLRTDIGYWETIRSYLYNGEEMRSHE